MSFTTISNFFFSKALLFYTVLSLNFLNLIDKITTYIGMNAGFLEMNQRAVYFFDMLGVSTALMIRGAVVIIASVMIYAGIKKLSEKMRYAIPITTLIFFIWVGVYSKFAINNIGWLI